MRPLEVELIFSGAVITSITVSICDLKIANSMFMYGVYEQRELAEIQYIATYM